MSVPLPKMGSLSAWKALHYRQILNKILVEIQSSPYSMHCGIEATMRALKAFFIGLRLEWMRMHLREIESIAKRVIIKFIVQRNAVSSLSKRFRQN